MHRLLPLLCCAALAGCIEYFPELPDLGPNTDDGMVDDGMVDDGMVDDGMVDDGMVDRDLPDAICRPVDEICDGIDDDCDGMADEEVPGCDPGCDAIDDDEDGRTDEGCAAVTCDGLGLLPPCNGGPDGLEILSGWVYIPSGEALLGSPEAEPGPVDERPQQPARISRGFLMMQTEMTQGMWRALAADDPIAQGSPSYFDGVDGRICDAEAPDECPVERISWIDAAWAANALSDRDGLTRCYAPAQLDALAGCNGPVGAGCDPGQPDCAVQGCNVVPLEALHDLDPACDGYRLPTSAEWTHAARGGSRTRYWPGEGVGDLAAVDWYAGNAGGHTHRVGRPPVSDAPSHPWGLYDMHGNVAEWVHDGYGPLPGPAPEQPMVDPLLLTYSADARVLRGGTWGTVAAGSRLAIRAPLSASQRNQALGVRFVRTVDARPASGPRIVSLTGVGGVAPPLDALLPGDTVTLEAEVTVEGDGDGGPLTGALYLIARPPGSRARSVEVGRFEDEGERWRVTIPWAVINAAGPGQFAPGVGDVRRFAARFSDAAGRGHLAYIRLTFGCEADGEPAHLCDGVCRDAPGVACDVTCDGSPDDAGPPCNDCPAGTLVPGGWVCIPGGDFVMGTDEPAADGIEGPAHAVRVTRPFLMMQTEVTRDAWAAAAIAAGAEEGAWPSSRGEGDPACRAAGQDGACPVQSVGWWEATWYANALTRGVPGLSPCYAPDPAGCAPEGVAVELGRGCAVDFCRDPDGPFVCGGADAPFFVLLDNRFEDPAGVLRSIADCDGYRLPTEAEWARAAALGAPGAPADDAPDVNAPVRSAPADGAGLYGMGGGVWEWMSDALTKYANPAAEVRLVDPVGATNAAARALRGRDPRRTVREAGDPASKYFNIGLRLVRTVPGEGPPAPAPPRIRFPLGRPTPLSPDEPSTIVVGVEGFEPDGLQVQLDFEGSSSAAGQRIIAFVGQQDGGYIAVVDWQTLMGVAPVTATPGNGQRNVLVRVVDANGLNRTARTSIPLVCRVGDQDAPICDGVCQAEVDAVCPE